MQLRTVVKHCSGRPLMKRQSGDEPTQTCKVFQGSGHLVTSQGKSVRVVIADRTMCNSFTKTVWPWASHGGVR